MLTSLINTCTDCGSLEDAMCEMDGAIAQAIKNAHMNLVYLSNKKISACNLNRLIWYRHILEQLKGNSDYYCPKYTMVEIVSRARALVAGMPKIAKRWTLPVYTSSTTTSTTTTTTSTTTTSTSTTTTTT